jgi:hypothetical protein
VIVRVTLAVLALGACGDDDGDGTDLAEAFCADLESGLSIAQITRSFPDVYGDDVNIPAQVSVLVEDACPERLESDEALRGFLEANGFDPDNLP